MATNEKPFSVLFVCTGNVCRSPLAEYLLEKQLDDLSSVAISSAGTNALVGEAMDDRMAEIARILDIPNTSEHRGRQLTEKMLVSADLILTMTREHRRQVVELVPSAIKRTFTLREFARLLVVAKQAGEDSIRPVERSSESMRRAVKKLPEYRFNLERPVDPSVLDVIDPYRRDDETYIASTNQLLPCVDEVGIWAKSFRSVTA